MKIVGQHHFRGGPRRYRSASARRSGRLIASVNASTRVSALNGLQLAFRVSGRVAGINRRPPRIPPEHRQNERNQMRQSMPYSRECARPDGNWRSFVAVTSRHEPGWALGSAPHRFQLLASLPGLQSAREFVNEADIVIVASA
jgi:hypothetical protein